MKIKQLLLFTLFTLIVTTLPLQAQDQQQSRIDEAIAIIQQYAYRIPGMLQKTIDCALGRATCSQEEINQTRTIMGLVAGAVVLLGTGLGARALAKRRGWWPFGTKVTPEPQPIPQGPTITQEQAGNAAKLLSDMYIKPIVEQKQKIENIKKAINTIDSAIDQKLITLEQLQEVREGQMASLETIIQHFITQGLTSKYIQPKKRK
jgi:hypothetical protein